MARTIEVSEPVKELLKYCDEGAGLYWDPEYDFTFWSSSDWASESPDIRVGGYETFLQASGRDTLEGLQGDQVITASIEIPDRRPGRPRKRTVSVEQSTLDLPASLWQEVDKAKGAASRQAYVEAAIREKLERESAQLITAMDEWRTQLESLLQQYDEAITSLTDDVTPAAEQYLASLKASYEWLITVNQSLDNVVGISHRAIRR